MAVRTIGFGEAYAHPVAVRDAVAQVAVTGTFIHLVFDNPKNAPTSQYGSEISEVPRVTSAVKPPQLGY